MKNLHYWCEMIVTENVVAMLYWNMGNFIKCKNRFFKKYYITNIFIALKMFFLGDTDMSKLHLEVRKCFLETNILL